MPNRSRHRQEKASAAEASGGLAPEALLAAVVDSSSDAIITKGLDGKILTWNAAAVRLYGFSAQEAIGRPITIIVPSEQAADVWMILRRISNGERVEHYETVRCHKDGSRIDVSLTVSPVIAADGEVVAASVITRDISQRLRDEEAARESNQVLQSLLMEMPLYAVITASDRRIRFCNSSLASLAGEEPARLVGRVWDEVFGTSPADERAWDRLDGGAVTPHYDGQIRAGNGEVRDVAWSNVAVDRRAGHLLASMGLDVTASKAAADELARATADRDSLMDAVLEAEIDERARLAEALHDDTVQALTATLFQLDSALAGALDDRPVRRARDTLSDTLGRVRRLMFELRPRVLDEDGLAAALRLLAAEAAADAGFTVEVSAPDGRFSRAVEELVYRTVREAVLNSVRHSGAGTVRITVVEQPGELHGTVADDGVGFDLVSVGSRSDANLHIGLAAMAERVRLARGELEVASAPGAGTTIRFTIPEG
jgi:PAS domain S-box-containing protein